MCKWLNDFAMKTQPCAWFLLRVIASLMFMIHGAQKLFGLFGGEVQSITGGMGFFGLDVGLNMLWLAGFIEFFGGLLLVLGLFTRWVAGLGVILMVFAYLHAHLGWNPLATGGEAAVLYFLVYLALFAYGAGPKSLDALLFEKKGARKAAKKK